MLDEYDIKNLNPRKNPYAKKLKKQISINIDGGVIDYFKQQANETGIPYQTLINLYLADCVEKKKKLKSSEDLTALGVFLTYRADWCIIVTES